MKEQSKKVYDGDFKRKAVELHLKERYGYKKVARMLGIPSATSVRHWTNTYESKATRRIANQGSHCKIQFLQRCCLQNCTEFTKKKLCD